MNLPTFPSTAAFAASPRPPAEPARGLPLLRLGFRPFYLGAAAYAAIAVPLWLLMLLGGLHAPAVPVPLWWHAHEMLFGFAAAVIVGFLLTAGQAWTGVATPRGASLGALALLWLTARLAAWVAPPGMYAALDIPLLPVVAAVLARALLRAGNRRNLPLVGLLMLLTLVNVAFHLSAGGWLPISPLRVLHAGLALVVLIECVLAGRVVPAFTVSATPGLRLGTPAGLSPLALAGTAAGLAAWVLLPPNALTAACLALAAAAHAVLLWHWRPAVTRGRPILWVLHAAYAWIPIGLALLALAQLGLLAVSAGIHALAVGATGGLIIGMMTRTARGHTGRPLRASQAEVSAYGLILLAAALRVGLPLVVAPAVAWIAAAVAWSTGFLIYLVVFAPWLAAPRLDGKDG